MEQELILKYKTNDSLYGYNISKGGDGFDSQTMLNRWQNEESKNNMVEAMREAWKDPEKRKRRSEAAKARWANAEFKEFAMSRVRQACAKAVRCVETGEVFDMIATAAHKYGVNKCDIGVSCRKGYRCGGYHWEYA